MMGSYGQYMGECFIIIFKKLYSYSNNQIFNIIHHLLLCVIHVNQQGECKFWYYPYARFGHIDEQSGLSSIYVYGRKLYLWEDPSFMYLYYC